MTKTKRWNYAALNVLLFIGIFPQLHAQNWLTTGNANTTSSHFIGTTDGAAFRIRTNNLERIFVSASGFVGFGTTTSIGASNFVISSNISGWAGMYTNGTASSTKPFYGYSVAGTGVAYHYYDPAKSAWILNVGGGDRVTVSNSGYVGIGVASPTSSLDVYGSGHFGGDLSAASGHFSGAVIGTNGGFSGTLHASGNLDAQDGLFDGDVTAGGSATFGTISSAGTGYFGGAVQMIGNVEIGGGAGINSRLKIIGNATNFQTGIEIVSSWNGLFIDGTSTNQGIFAGAFAPGATNFGAVIMAGTDLLTTEAYGLFASASAPSGNPNAYSIVCNGTGYYTGNWYQLSDQRFKTNVKSLNSALNIIKQLQPKQYEYKRDEYNYLNFPAGEQYGFIAQDVEKIAPFLVKDASQPVDVKKPGGDKVEFKMVNYIGLIPVLTEAMQEQQLIIEKQDSVIQQQNERLARLENIVEKLSPGAIDSQKENAAGNIQVNRLYPNQPNPFSEETIIKYKVSNDAANASVVIRNMEGTVQQTFVLTQKGESFITVQARDMKAGLYTYELVVDGKIVDTKKMVITK